MVTTGVTANISAIISPLAAMITDHTNRLSTLEATLVQTNNSIDEKIATQAAEFHSYVKRLHRVPDTATQEIVKRLDVQTASLAAKLDKLDAAFLNLTPAASSAAASSSGGPPPQVRRFYQHTTISPDSTQDPVKVFFTGFKRDIPRPKYMKFWEHVKTTVPADLSASTVPYIGNKEAFSVGFPSKVAALDFIKATREREYFFPADAPAGSPVVQVAISLERAQRDNKYGKAFQKMWAALNPLLTQSAAWKVGAAKRFQTDTTIGKMKVSSDDEILVLYKFEKVDGTFTLVPDYANLAVFGISKGSADNILELYDAAAVA